jgi:16S rRNA (cytosine967-C5)-methyltransferase
MDGGDPASLAAVRDGRAAVQDEGSQLAALAVTGCRPGGPDDRWLDMCAGPGGKSVLLAGGMPSGARLLAADLQPHRARLVAGALGGAAASVLVADGTRGPWRPATFDRILLDAPCTGLGSLRRRPEVRWRRQPADVDRLQGLQVALLDAAADAARPGGVIAYVTCSPHRAETRDVVDRVMTQRGDLEWIDARPMLTGVPLLGPGPDIRLWPHRHGTDAMYVALLRSDLSSS